MAEAVPAPSPVSTVAAERENNRRHALNLFLVGFLVLFLELTCIRWFAAYVIFLQFFTNVVLIAAFLGMSCGCLAARRPQDWLEYFPLIAAGTVLAALGTFAAYHLWSGLAIDVGGQRSPQEVFFGTEYRDPDLAHFVVHAGQVQTTADRPVGVVFARTSEEAQAGAFSLDASPGNA